MSAQAAWQAFEAELARWRDAGRRVEFWWRDDDATAPSPALARLFALASDRRVPLVLAVIPGPAQPELFAQAPSVVEPIQHGTDHVNRAPDGARKTEYPPGEDVTAALGRLRAAREALATRSNGRALAVLAPPWNRMHAALAARLPEAGFHGLSRFGPRPRDAAPSAALRQANTHVDLIAWRGDRGFAGEAQVLGQAVTHLAAQRARPAGEAEATGWLSHHAVHDDATWTFLETLLARTAGRPGVAWRSARELFAPGPGP